MALSSRTLLNRSAGRDDGIDGSVDAAGTFSVDEGKVGTVGFAVRDDDVHKDEDIERARKEGRARLAVCGKGTCTTSNAASVRERFTRSNVVADSDSDCVWHMTALESAAVVVDDAVVCACAPDCAMR